MNLNKAMIIGNLTRDPETRTTPSGQTVTSFSVATNLIWTDANGEKQKKVEFHNIVAWRKLAEICAQYLKKGNKVYIEGRLQTRDWEGQDGVKRYRTEIIAENMIMLDTKGTSSGSRESTPSPTDDFSQPEPTKQEDEIQVENIPF
ncbi:MAG: single-stranded DNA-binding protein [Patescibacteria group bacterium]|jgi:single-strand DNA-binding protein